MNAKNRARRLGTASVTVLLTGACALGLTSPAHAATPTKAPSTSASKAKASVTATVANTGGENLIVRSKAGKSGPEVKRLAEGTSVQIECQVASDDVSGNKYWDYIPAHGGYASDYYLATPGHDGRHPDLPLCEDTPPPDGTMRERIVQIAKGEVGLTDKSKYGAPVDHDWCQYFVNWVWRNAGVEDMNDTHFTGDFYYWGKERGLTQDGSSNIKVGDGILFGTGPENSDTGRHVGIVVAVHEDGSVESIDGNYSDAVTRVGPYFPDNATTHEPENVYAHVSPPGD
ncbi:CHAP domain-containing protein [Streptomyces sp. NPDC005438]|uniref:CHAP domain-containing protein n=1 Tax=Streptomyces sp. NPDC005438 TaxID=3156880 RepID=UPI00339E85D9